MKLLNGVLMGQVNGRKVRPEIVMIHHRLMDDVVRKDLEKVLGVHKENYWRAVAYYYA